MDSYLTPAQIRTIATSLPGMTAVVAMDDATLTIYGQMASLTIDTAMRYQGRKYLYTQTLEFPRWPYSGGNEFNVIPGTPLPEGRSGGFEIWDWDYTNNVVVVPERVNIACVFQIAFMADASNAKINRRIRDIISGLSQQQVGTASESYALPADLVAYGGLTGLDRQAFNLMNKYRLVSGDFV